eukprot:s317_g38.t1
MRSPTTAAEVAEECLSAPFQRLLPVMRAQLRDSLADGLGEHVLPHLDQALQKRLLDGLGVETPASGTPSGTPLLPERIEALVVKCTEELQHWVGLEDELNSWFVSAPRFPATPLALADALARAEHPLLRFFTAVRQPQKKEAFLVAVALCLQSLRQRFSWMRITEPVLERLSHDLQNRLFFVQNKGPVMDFWFTDRMKKYNSEANARIAAIFAQPAVPKLEPLKALLLPLFPQNEDGPGDWLQVDSPSKVADVVLEWLVEGTSIYLPPHCLWRDTLLSLLRRTGRWMEVDAQTGLVRLAAVSGGLPPLPPLPPPPPGAASPKGDSTAESPEGDVDNLIDLLMKEALTPLSSDMRSMVQKIGHGDLTAERTLFTLLDTEEEGLINLDSFVSGCMQMYGSAKSMQMAKLSYENRLLRQAVSDFNQYIAAEDHRQNRGCPQLEYIVSHKGSVMSAECESAVAGENVTAVTDFAGLHQQLQVLQTLMEERFDHLEYKLDFKFAGQANVRTSEKRGSLSRLSRSDQVVGAPQRSSAISLSSETSQRFLSGYSDMKKAGSLVWEATATQRKTASRQSQLMMQRRSSGENQSVPLVAAFRAKVGRVVESAFVTQGVMLLVFAHVILLGIEVDISSRSSNLDDIPSWFSIVNLIIVSIFVVELLLKFIYLGCSGFWCGADSGWNFFDFFIVAVSVADVIVDYWSKLLSHSIVMEELRVLRSLRFVRAVRSIRIIRIFRYMAALRTLVLSVVSTMASLLWTLALLLVIIYAFGIIMTQVVAEHCRFLMLDGGNHCDENLQRWRSVPESMLTLFMTISQGIDWGVAIDPLRAISTFAVCLVLLYVVIAIFAVMNVVTGVFCQTAIESASNDKDVATMKQVNAKSQKISQLKTIFQEMDRENTNFVSFQDVKDAVHSPELKDFLESMGIISDDIWTWFMLLDTEQTGLVDLDAFVSGCMQLYGTARSMQMAKMSYENKLLRDAVSDMREEIGKEFATLKVKMNFLNEDF